MVVLGGKRPGHGSEGGSICQGNEEVSLLHLLHLLQLFQGSEWVPYCSVVTVIILFQGSEGGGVRGLIQFHETTNRVSVHKNKI